VTGLGPSDSVDSDSFQGQTLQALRAGLSASNKYTEAVLPAVVCFPGQMGHSVGYPHLSLDGCSLNRRKKLFITDSCVNRSANTIPFRFMTVGPRRNEIGHRAARVS
jgi:hypothetical protein